MMADGSVATASRGTDEGRPLADRFRAGEAGAFEEVIREYQDTVARLVYRLGGWSAADVEDIAQEVFVAAMGAARRFDGRSSLGTWLTRIAINRCRSERRKRMVRVRFWKRAKDEASREGPRASMRAEESERAGRVAAEVRRLPGKYREVVVLRYLEGMEVDEVARAMRLSRGAVEVRLSRAREALRERLADVWKE